MLTDQTIRIVKETAPAVAAHAEAITRRFYALMLWRLNGTIPSRLQLIYLGDSQVLTYDPAEDELVSFEKTLRALWTTITRAAAQGNWQAKESRLCGWCDHHAKCPAKGGTPPPLPIDLTSR